MSVEWFLKLKEIDSLGKMRINHLRAFDEQQERLNKLLERKEVSLLQTNALNLEYRSLQQNLHELEKKLRLFSVQRENLISLGGDDDKIANFTREIATLENDGFELMENQDAIQAELADLKTFLHGLEKTITEIEIEANEEKKLQQVEIKRIELRLNMLEEELPQNFQQVFRRTLAKKLNHGPFTRIDNNSCFFCRHKIPRQEEIEIDMQQNLKTCNQCGRIFLPYGS